MNYFCKRLFYSTVLLSSKMCRLLFRNDETIFAKTAQYHLSKINLMSCLKKEMRPIRPTVPWNGTVLWNLSSVYMRYYCLSVKYKKTSLDVYVNLNKAKHAQKLQLHNGDLTASETNTQVRIWVKISKKKKKQLNKINRQSKTNLIFGRYAQRQSVNKT